MNLGIFSFKASNEARHIFNSVEGSDGILDKYNQQKSYSCYVTDLASNCKAAFDSEENMQWLGCFSYTLHLIVKAGLKVDGVRELVVRLRRISTFFKSSGLAHVNLKYNEQLFGLS